MGGALGFSLNGWLVQCRLTLPAARSVSDRVTDELPDAETPAGPPPGPDVARLTGVARQMQFRLCACEQTVTARACEQLLTERLLMLDA